MTKQILIDQLADVLLEIAAERKHQGSFVDVSELRKGAVSAVAARYNVEERTIADGFIRRLRPDISSTAEFDKAIDEYEKSKSRKLEEALLRRIGNGAEAIRVFHALEALKTK